MQCNYVIYWRRYARFVEEALGAEEAARVWERATGKLLKRRPEPFLDFALFREAHGQVDEARELFKHVLGFGNSSLRPADTHTHTRHTHAPLRSALLTVYLVSSARPRGSDAQVCAAGAEAAEL